MVETREERIARIRKMREKRMQTAPKREGRAPSFLEKFSFLKKEWIKEEVKEETKEEIKEEPVVEEAPKKKRGRKKKEALDE